MQGASHVHGASKYASGAASGASIDESEMEGSLPPIMGVMGNNSNKMGMQQTYKYDKMADNKAAAKRKKKPKNVSGFDGKRSYSNIPSYGGQQGGVSKTYGGPGVGANLSVASGAGQAQTVVQPFQLQLEHGGHQQAKSTSLVGQGHPQGNRRSRPGQALWEELEGRRRFGRLGAVGVPGCCAGRAARPSQTGGLCMQQRESVP